jgi:5'-nucleotidase / UDP-sugar diphosphatase
MFRHLVFLVPLLSMLLPLCSPVWAVTRELVILHTNDSHAHTLPDARGIGGYAAISGYIKSVKAKESNVLVVDDGDMISGSPVSTAFKGDPIFEILNTIPYDCAALGNHEFDHGWTRIERYQSLAKFPLLCANVITPKGKHIGDAETHFVNLGGIRIGIIGVVTSDLDIRTARKGYYGLKVEKASDAIGRLLPSVKAKSDVVVVIAHCGIKEDKIIAAANDGIDIMICGHSHGTSLKPIIVNGAILARAGVYTHSVGRFDLSLDTAIGKIIKYKHSQIVMDTAKHLPDEETAKVVRKWENKIKDLVGEVIGKNAKHKKRTELTRTIGTIFKRKYKTDYGYQNTGGVRSGLYAGEITKRMIWEMMPFSNHMVVLKLKGSTIKDFYKIEPFAGMDRTYTLATNSYVADHAIEALKLGKHQYTRHADIDREVVIEYIKAKGNMEIANF